MELFNYVTPIRDLSKEPLKRGEYLAWYRLVCIDNTPQGDGSLVYKCSINGNIPSNVLNVAEPSSLRKLNEQKSKKLRIVFQNYIDSDEYLDVGLTDMYDSLQSVNGHLDFSYYTFSDEYEVMFSVSNARATST